MSQIMVEGVGGWQDFWGGLTSVVKEAPGHLAETTGSLVDALSPGFKAYAEYQTAKEFRKLAEPKVTMPAATVKYITAPAAAAPAPVPGVTLVSMPAAAAAPAPAAGLGINTKTLLIGGAVLAALLLLKGK